MMNLTEARREIFNRAFVLVYANKLEEFARKLAHNQQPPGSLFVRNISKLVEK